MDINLKNKITEYIKMDISLDNVYSMIACIDRLKNIPNFKDDELIISITKEIYKKIDMELLQEKLVAFAEAIDLCNFSGNHDHILIDLKEGNYKTYVSTIEDKAIKFAEEIAQCLSIYNFEEYNDLIARMELCTSALKDLNVLRRLDYSYKQAFAKEILVSKDMEIYRQNNGGMKL